MKKIYNKGWSAFSNGSLRKDNPYTRGTQEFNAWLQGYNDHYNDLEKYVCATCF